LSPLTKAFVVLVTVLSILLVALVVPFVAKTGTLTNEISTLQTQVQVAEAAATTSRAETTRLLAVQSGGNADLEAAVNTLRSENLRLAQQLATANAAEQQAANELAKASATKTIMAQSGDRLTELVQDRTQALAEAQNELVTTKKANAELVMRNNELDAQVNTLTASLRLMKERMAGAGGGPAASSYTGAGSARVADNSKTVRGNVSDVESTNGITLIQINVGANDGLQPGSKVLIYRGGDVYVATAVVDTVDGNVSVARVNQSNDSIRAGDSVLAGVSF